MCGINGIYSYHPAARAPSESELLATRDAMRVRGPDGCGIWWKEDRRCAFGHRRLSILDLSERASQPMASESGRFVIVFNGEIYNFRELHAELEERGVRFRTSSDTEVLLHLYEKFGSDMVHKLRGMFAFAIWDNARNGLFLARDPYGIKPLYTVNDGWTFRFASQVKALLAGGKISRDPEPAGVVGFQLFGSVPEPFTLFRDVRALPAGHTQWIDSSGPFEPKRFANLAAVLADGARQESSSTDLAGLVRHAALNSVKRHLLADVEVGLFLSAGVDSGALLGLMRDAGKHDVLAMTLSFDEFHGTDEDESPLARLVAEHYGARHIVRRVNEAEFLDDLPAILAAMDQPSIDGVNTWFVAKTAKESGIKVALSGVGGDELLAGYTSFTDMPRWRARLKPFASIPGLGWLGRAALRRFAPEWTRRKPKALGLLEYGNSWSGIYLLRRALFLPFELQGLLDPELVRIGLRRLKPLRLLGSHLEPDPGSDVGRVCALESLHYMRNQLLRDADWAGMAHGVEIRTPLVDFQLLKSLAPVIGRLVPGAGKAALASAPSLSLPSQITNRAKTGFGVPTSVWMNKLSASSDLAIRVDNRSKGLISRRWSQFVFSRADIQNAQTCSP